MGVIRSMGHCIIDGKRTERAKDRHLILNMPIPGAATGMMMAAFLRLCDTFAPAIKMAGI